MDDEDEEDSGLMILKKMKRVLMMRMVMKMQ